VTIDTTRRGEGGSGPRVDDRKPEPELLLGRAGDGLMLSSRLFFLFVLCLLNLLEL